VKKVLITGGAGFIGSHLAERCVAEGIEVVAVDDLSTGRLENLRPVEDSPLFHFHEGDIRQEGVLESALAGCDTIVHLAARIGLKLVVQSSLATLETNVEGTESVFRAARKNRTNVLVASTSEVYGLATRIPSSEDDPITIGSPVRNRWSYAASKALDEFIALGNHRERGVPSTVVRLFNTVGPRQSGRYGMVVPTFVSQALSGEPLTVYGDGTQTRCFCHVRDVVGALIRLANEPSAAGHVFNLGNPVEVTINELARRVITMAGSSSEIRYVPHSTAYGEDFEEIARRVPDITRIRSAIGFAPEFGLDDILREVIAERSTPVAV
jgi:UDP-glucose 4-epimerase